MGKFTKLAAALLLSSGLSSAAWAVVITEGPSNGTNVGGIDSLVQHTNSLDPCGPGSSTAAETCWVNNVLGGGAEFQVKTETVAIFSTDTTGVLAFELAGQPDYFLVKNATFWALFQNVPDSDWGVIDSALLPSGMNINDGTTTISHVSEFSADVPGVVLPVPGALLLFGAGLAGLGITRRRQQA